MSLILQVKEQVPLALAISMFDLEPPRGRSWRCPFPEGHNHLDRNRSATIFVARDGFEWFTCMACGRKGDVVNLAQQLLGCTPKEAVHYLANRAGIISAAPALSVRREVAEYRSKQKQVPAVEKTLGTLVKTYDYLDEDGALLFQVCRFDPKDFRQRRPDGNGGWIWNLRGARRVPYRLPQVIAAINAGKAVWVAEGEKDADTLTELGYCGTTVPGGAGKWQDSYTELFVGADVVIVCDNDQAGRMHGDTLRAALEGAARNLWVLTPAQGKDVTEMLAQGLPVTALREVG